MKIAFGSDHAGVELKEALMAYLEEKGHTCLEYGNTDPTDRSDDYPVYGLKVAKAVQAGEADKGVLVCGTGVGMSLVANKVKGIRAVVCSEPYSARLSVQHNNAHILCVGARVIGRELAKDIADAFFSATFEGGRHAERVQMITDIENA